MPYIQGCTENSSSMKTLRLENMALWTDSVRQALGHAFSPGSSGLKPPARLTIHTNSPGQSWLTPLSWGPPFILKKRPRVEDTLHRHPSLRKKAGKGTDSCSRLSVTMPCLASQWSGRVWPWFHRHCECFGLGGPVLNLHVSSLPGHQAPPALGESPPPQPGDSPVVHGQQPCPSSGWRAKCLLSQGQWPRGNATPFHHPLATSSTPGSLAGWRRGSALSSPPCSTW